MNTEWIHHAARLNLIVGWAWIILGFASGLALGLNFHKENWLGGFGSFRRRLYRLAHISFFGLGAVNLLYHWTSREFVRDPAAAGAIASLGFVAGAVTMPLGCLLTAHRPGLRGFFAVPVASLLGAGILTLWEVCR